MSIQNTIENKLNQELTPEYLEVINEDNLHNSSPGAETYFKLTIVSQAFDGVRLLARHRLVKQVVKHELETHITSLSLHTYTPSEWHHLFSSLNNANGDPFIRVA